MTAIGASTVGEDDFFAGAYGLDRLRKLLVRLAQSEPHVVMILPFCDRRCIGGGTPSRPCHDIVTGG